MLDIRIETFLTLCDTRSYTKTARLLNMTQPAVTQHIKYLEKRYEADLVEYSGRRLIITESGNRLRNYAIAMRANNIRIEEDMKHPSDRLESINFGSTLTIGEYFMPDKILEYLLKYPDTNIKMLVGNTSVLLEKLEQGLIDFAVVEGYFDREKYDHIILKREEYVGVCAKNNPLSGKELTFDDILSERLITREPGSGTREIMENILRENNLSLAAFRRIVEIGNFNAIKELVIKNMGITFVYRSVVEYELESGELSRLKLGNSVFSREFSIVFLKNDINVKKYKEFLNFLQKVY